VEHIHYQIDSYQQNYASSARKNEDKCGEKALYFEENTNKIVTVPYYFILNVAKYWMLIPVLVFFVIYIDLIYKFICPRN